MRIGIASFALLLLASIGASGARAQFGDISVATEWVADANIGGGGYVSVQVVDNGSAPVFAVLLGDNNEINVTYTSPSIAGYWYSWVVPKGDWQANNSGLGTYPWFTPPDTSVEPYLWENFFLTNYQAVVWQVNQEAQAIQPDDPTITEFRYLIGTGAKRSTYGPLPYMVMGTDGEVLGSGETSITGVVPTDSASFGRVKQLFAH
jgi:hypothetical protein